MGLIGEKKTKREIRRREVGRRNGKRSRNPNFYLCSGRLGDTNLKDCTKVHNSNKFEIHITQNRKALYYKLDSNSRPLVKGKEDLPLRSITC